MRRSWLASAVALALLGASCGDDPVKPSERTPPGAIDDLRAARRLGSTLVLSWTAPGDDSTTGRATRYEVRSAPSPATLVAWTGATPVGGVPVPQAAGAAESLVVGGLADGAVHYFGVRAVDDAGNVASASNQVVFAAMRVPQSPADLIAALALAYDAMDPNTFAWLLADEPGAGFLFFLNEPLPGGVNSWGVEDERRIHHRMFTPWLVVPPAPPVPPELWLVDIDIALRPQGSFTERTDFYAPEGPLDGARWKAWEGLYSTYVFFQTRGDTHYQVTGSVSFIVIEDRTVPLGQDRKFLVYRWHDLGSEAARGGAPGAAVERPSWGLIKTLYSE